MISQFSKRLSEILAFSREEAQRLCNTEVGPEHLLLGIFRENSEDVRTLFEERGINIGNLKKEVEDTIRGRKEDTPEDNKPELNNEAARAVKLSILTAREQNTQMVDEQHLLLALLHSTSECSVKDLLEKNDMNYNNVYEFYKRKTTIPKDGIDLPDEDDEVADRDDKFSKNGDYVTEKDSPKGGKTPVIDSFGTDLTKAAANDELDPLVGRSKEIERITEILCRRKKNNPILIGEPGVGKSAIVEGLAQLIVKHRTSPMLFGKRLVALDMTGLVAGTKYRGQFEERIRALIKELEHNPEIIIFIDEIHTLIGAGSTPGSMDAANILKPALARGTIQCIGATTINEYKKTIEKDGALERRFQKILVEPTTTEETLTILNNIKDRYEQYHNVTYSDDAIKSCVKLTERYINDRFFPDKAIDALDEAGARVHLRYASVPKEIIEAEKELKEIKRLKLEAVKNQDFELAAGYRDKQTTKEHELEDMNKQWTTSGNSKRETVTEKDMTDVISVMSGVPVYKMAEAEGKRLAEMGDVLNKEVIAQEKAIDTMVKSIQRSRIGLRDPNRPIGVFMFLGPTGVGKTYLAKKLAEYMFGSVDALIRIDMSEYTEAFNVSRLVGAPPGYVGYEDGGQLTEKVKRHPYSIVLLDEIEKAHGNVYNILLQVMDDGRLTDGNGTKVDFRNTVIIMTSNAGTRHLKEFGRGVGFTATSLDNGDIDERGKEHAREVISKSLSKQFSPEFLNRIDEIITFDQLDIEAVKKIVDIELGKTLKRMKDLGYVLNVTEAAKDFMAHRGYDVQYGARPLKRVIRKYIEDEVCSMILNEKLSKNDILTVDKDSEKDKLTYTVGEKKNETEAEA